MCCTREKPTRPRMPFTIIALICLLSYNNKEKLDFPLTIDKSKEQKSPLLNKTSSMKNETKIISRNISNIILILLMFTINFVIMSNKSDFLCYDKCSFNVK